MKRSTLPGSRRPISQSANQTDTSRAGSKKSATDKSSSDTKWPPCLLTPMHSAPHSASYIEHVARLERQLGVDDALRRAVGGEFIATGKLEYYLLADFVCFFSVFTHLRHEDIFRYFREAHRVLKPGGLLLISFLEFRVPTHWHIFEASVNGTRDDEHLNQFIDREAIYTWAVYSGFDVRQVYPGNTEYIPLPEEICFEDGSRMNGAGSLGQSIAVLQKHELTGKPPVYCAVSQSLRHRAAPKVGAADHVLIAPLPATAPVAPVLNASARCFVRGGSAAVLGFIVGGTTNRRLLVRAIGPALMTFGVVCPLANPSLAIWSGEGECVGNSLDWGGDPLIAAASGIVGAFSLARDSKDAVLIVALVPGSYTAVVDQ